MSTLPDIIDIPMIIRGEIIEPDESAVEYGGRVGLRFRHPDARKYASQLTLADASRLQDLADTPIDEILDFLAELGPRLTLERNELMDLAFRVALEAGDLTEPVLRPVYDQTPAYFDRHRLDVQVEKTVGKAFLDGWVELGAPGRSSMRMRAVGTRQMHVVAGNVPITAALTVIRAAVTKGDCLVKMASNDPFTPAAIVKSMIELDPDHPVTRHFAVAYWKGGDEVVEREIYRPARIEKLVAWGGMSSMTHIQKYLVPGIELIAMNPKYSISIVGHEALEDDDAMAEAAIGVALMAGRMNQTACSSTRVVYVECDADDEDDLDRLERFGHAIHRAFLDLPPEESTNPKAPNPELESELAAVALEDDFYRVIGDTATAGVVVSRQEEAVEFADQLNNRIVNLVPMAKIARCAKFCNESTQTVGIYPERLREAMRDDLALHGVQRVMPLGGSLLHPDRNADPEQGLGIPHDGIEPNRRTVRWVVDSSAAVV